MTAPCFKFIARWYDLWVGFYWDRDSTTLYFLPVPCLGVAAIFGARAVSTRLATVAEALRKAVANAGEVTVGQVRKLLEDVARQRGYLPVGTAVTMPDCGTFVVSTGLIKNDYRHELTILVTTRPL